MDFYSTTLNLGNTKGSASWTFSVQAEEGHPFIVTVNGNLSIEMPAPTAGGAPTTAAINGDNVTGKLQLSLQNGRYWLALVTPNIVWPDWAGLTGGPLVLATWENS